MWKQEGKIYLWKYASNQKNYPGWNFTADNEGCRSFLTLLELMEAADWPCKRKISVSHPTRQITSVPNNRGNTAKWSAPNWLEIQFRRGDPLNEWSLKRADHGTVLLKLGLSKLKELRTAVEGVLQGQGDFSIQSEEEDALEDGCLWFWWYPAQ